MSQQDWTGVDAYIGDKLHLSGDVFAKVLEANAAAGLPAIDVSPAQGKYLQLMVRITGAKRVLEIGTLGGYSTVWMAQALPESGQIVTLESEPLHAEVAKANFVRAGVADKVDLRLGMAADSLAALTAEEGGPFDFIFIDADKPGNPVYLDWALKLSRRGTVIIADNVVRSGSIISNLSHDPSTKGVRALFDMVSGHPRLDVTALQTVGEKGWDGFALMVVK